MAFNRPVPIKVGNDIEVWNGGISCVEIRQHHYPEDDYTSLVIPRERLEELIAVLRGIFHP